MKIQRHSFRDYSAESKFFTRSALLAFSGIFILTCILIVNLYNLQIICFEDYLTRSNENSIKRIPIAPSRGIIYDRNGTPVAINRMIYQLELIPEKIKNLYNTIEALRPIVNLTDENITFFEKKRKQSHRFISIPIKIDLTDVQQARFVVNKHRFPGVEVKAYQRRYYPYGSALTHVIGYVSKINDRDVERLHTNGVITNYAGTYDIGKLGIERYYENTLHGQSGYEKIEVNNRGKLIRQLNKKSPQAGTNITLTIDLRLQQYIEKMLCGTRAAVVVVDPSDGAIRALVSHPSYNPNRFVDGISKIDYHILLSDKNRPLINRTIQGMYPPASTVKPYISVSALTIGLINKNFSIFDPGWWQLPGSDKRYRDWKRRGHGRVNVTRALEESVDTFFYQVAYDMGIDQLSEWMTKFGYGKYTGIDLLEENTGIMPTRFWKIARFKQPWYQGDTIPVGIGQGYWIATPIQMSKALMTLINDGEIRTPHLLSYMLKNGRQIPYLHKKYEQIGDPHSGYWEIAKDGMYGVANRLNGTARKSFLNTPYKVAAKSGTAQVFSLKPNKIYNKKKITERLRDHKLMIAFAPYDKPTVGVVVILENGGTGLTVGTIIRKILDHILLDDHTMHFPSEKPAS